METINKNRNKEIDELNIANILCSIGCLPPRNERDIELFERVYRGRNFKITAHNIDADAIFNKVLGEEKVMKTRMMPLINIFNSPGALRVANNAADTIDDSVADTFNQLIINKKDQDDTESI